MPRGCRHKAADDSLKDIARCRFRTHRLWPPGWAIPTTRSYIVRQPLDLENFTVPCGATGARSPPPSCCCFFIFSFFLYFIILFFIILFVVIFS